VPVETLQRALGPASGAHLAALSWGRDDRQVVPSEPDKSIGHEETFSRDVDDPEVVLREVLRLSERTAARLREQGYAARTITLKVRFSDFTTLTRSRTLPQVTDSGREIYEIGRELFRKLGLQRARLRLVGVRAESLVASGQATRQLAMGDRETGWREADRAVDRAVARFGTGSVQPATLVDPPGR
jgi:DNA polymerase IV